MCRTVVVASVVVYIYMYSRVNLGSCEVVAVLGVNIVDGELALQLLLPPLRPLATLHTVKRQSHQSVKSIKIDRTRPAIAGNNLILAFN